MSFQLYCASQLFIVMHRDLVNVDRFRYGRVEAYFSVTTVTRKVSDVAESSFDQLVRFYPTESLVPATGPQSPVFVR